MSEGTKVVSSEPLLVEPMLAPPVLVEPVAVGPVVVDPLLVEPAVVDPLVVEPAVVEPVVVESEYVVSTPVQPVVEPGYVESVVAVAPVATHAVRRSYARSFAPDSIVAALVGLFLLLVGLLAITRGGFDGPMSDPVVSVLGFTHTTTLGLLEIIIGGALLLSGATRSRSGALFFGSVLGIAAFVGAVQTESFTNSLALESGFAWLMVIGAIAVVLAALLLPRYSQRSTIVY